MICPAAEKKKTAAGQADSPCLYFIPCGGFHFSKPPLFIGHSHDFSNAKPITVGTVPISSYTFIRVFPPQAGQHIQ